MYDTLLRTTQYVDYRWLNTFINTGLRWRMGDIIRTIALLSVYRGWRCESNYNTVVLVSARCMVRMLHFLHFINLIRLAISYHT